MKRFAKVALLAAMMFGFVATASAGELKTRAQMNVYAQWSQNLYDLSSEEGDSDNNSINQRARLYFDYISSKNLKMVMGFEIDSDWGIDAGVGTDQSIRGSKNGATNKGGALEVKHAYLDFTLPETVVNIKAGLQPLAFPGVFGSPIFDDDVPALSISAPVTDQVTITAGFVRCDDTASDNSENFSFDTQADGVFLLVPVKTDAFSVTPYAAYAWYKDSTEDNDKFNAWWIGANAALTVFDPLTIEADLMYGARTSADDDNKMKGWYGALAASYKLDMVTPVLFGTYASGANDDDSDGYEVMPTVSEGWAISPFTGSRLFGTSYDTWALAGTDQEAGLGMWTVGLILKDITFVDNLSHSLTIAYMRGTGDEDSASFLTKKDSAIEVALMNKYMIFENLAAIIELDYMAPTLKADKYDGVDEDPAAYVAAGFQYKF